jgi:hypothetical protein
VRSKNKVKSGVKDLLKDDGTYAHADSDKAEILNSFFASVVTDEDLESIPEPDCVYSGVRLLDIDFNEDSVLK